VFYFVKEILINVNGFLCCLACSPHVFFIISYVMTSQTLQWSVKTAIWWILKQGKL